jgi:hypothetical protein
MTSRSIDYGDIKRKIRELKKLEVKIRYGDTGFKDNFKGTFGGPQNAALVWDEFFDLHEEYTAKRKYSILELAVMDKEEFKNVINEFFFNVYFKFYKENGIINTSLYSPDMLNQMGLPYNADSNDIKKRFRELAKKYHPDAGGDDNKFIELIENYEKLKDMCL